MRTSDFHYDLPDEAIAQAPIEPRDAARLLDTRDLSDHVFRDLPALLQAGDLLVLNRTRVRPARLIMRKQSGGVVELLMLRPRGDGVWEAMVRPARRIRPGVILEAGVYQVEVIAGPVEGVVSARAVSGSVEDVLAAAGEIPLPPYFHGRLDDPERYQTVYAERPGSAAAPTAGLHFTPAVLEAVRAAGIGTAFVDLEIGLDTFRPISADDLSDHRMHSERVIVPDTTVDAVDATSNAGGRVVAVGTTVVRSLEAAARDGGLRPFDGETDLFITPGFDFRVVDLLVTNFHVPGSTLVVLLAAFLGDRWRVAYQHALDRGYRFLSFGDSMLAERP